MHLGWSGRQDRHCLFSEEIQYAQSIPGQFFVGPVVMAWRDAIRAGDVASGRVCVDHVVAGSETGGPGLGAGGHRL